MPISLAAVVAAKFVKTSSGTETWRGPVRESKAKARADLRARLKVEPAASGSSSGGILEWLGAVLGYVVLKPKSSDFSSIGAP
jgi:hypothetical protein